MAPAALSDDVRALADGLVGKDSAEAKPLLAAYTSALGRFTEAATTMCLAPPPPPKPSTTPAVKSTGKATATPSASATK